jgi:hypothetical protein
MQPLRAGTHVIRKSGKENTMTRIVIDAATFSKLQNLPGPVELCNEAGQLAGQFWPAFDPSQYEGLEPRISKEELRRRMENKGKTYTTAEVLAYLESL